MSAPAPRRRLLETSSGSITEAFGPTEWALLSGVALMWGSSFLLMDVGLESLRPGVVTAARILLGACGLAVLPAARRRVDRADLPRIALLGIAWMAIPMSLFPIAQQWVDSSVAGMINGAMPVFSALWAIVLLRRWPAPWQILGVLVGFGGILAISWPELTGSEATALGAGLALLAVACYGLGANLAVPLQQRYGALPVLLRGQLFALIFVGPVGVAQLGGSTWAWGPVLAMVGLGVLGTGLAFAFMVTLVGRVGGPRGSVAIYFLPVVAIVLGVAFRGEQVHPWAVLGTVLVLLGAWATSRRER